MLGVPEKKYLFVILSDKWFILRRVLHKILLETSGGDTFDVPFQNFSRLDVHFTPSPTSQILIVFAISRNPAGLIGETWELIAYDWSFTLLSTDQVKFRSPSDK